jgi:hypothetical protein
MNKSVEFATKNDAHHSEHKEVLVREETKNVIPHSKWIVLQSIGSICFQKKQCVSNRRLIGQQIEEIGHSAKNSFLNLLCSTTYF